MKFKKPKSLIYLLLMFSFCVSVTRIFGLYHSVWEKFIDIGFIVTTTICVIFIFLQDKTLSKTKKYLKEHRKEMEMELKKSKQWYDSLFHYNLDIVFSLNVEGEFTSVNPTGERVTEYSKEELLQMNFVPLIVQEDIERVLGHFTKAIQGEPQELEVAILSKQGNRVELLVTTVPIIIDNQIQGLIGVAKDITEEKTMQNRLKESEQRYKSLFDYNPDAILSFDLEGNFVSLNPGSEKISGYSKTELLQMKFDPLIVPDDLDKTLFHFEKAAKGEPQNYECSIFNKTGQRVFLNYQCSYLG